MIKCDRSEAPHHTSLYLTASLVPALISNALLLPCEKVGGNIKALYAHAGEEKKMTNRMIDVMAECSNQQTKNIQLNNNNDDSITSRARQQSADLFSHHGEMCFANDKIRKLENGKAMEEAMIRDLNGE